MDGERQQQRWTYFQFLELLFAYLGEGVYTADTGKWCEAVYQLRAEYTNEYPELFRGIFFATRPPLEPTSRQIEDFITWAGTGEALTVYNPDLEKLEFNRAEMKRLRERLEPVFGDRAKVVAMMAEKIRSRVSKRGRNIGERARHAVRAR